MIISELCTRGVKSCRPNDNLATAASIMWEGDCGAVPVVNEAGKLVGVITDRDICIAVGTRRNLAADIPVRDVMSGKVVSCSTGDNVKDALQVMRNAQIRRLPVLDENGSLKGIVSVNDIIRAVQNLSSKAAKEALLQEVILTLMAISQHHSSRDLEVSGPRMLCKIA